MAENGTVWGIDIGQAGLKALQLRYNEASQQVIAVGFDFIQHPKILSQPDAIPAELINEAMKTFVTRNAAQLRGAQIGFTVPSNTSIVKFIQLPPVEASKVGDIVKYEARQQIPFDLNDVIWDWQTMGGGIQEGGYMLDSEVGLVAMKKEALQNHLRPFTEQRLEIDTIQAVSLAMFNFMSYDQFEQRPGDPVMERDGYTVLLDMGADTTTMLVSNGRKIWQRNISIGGNQFTRALTKEMKLTFAKSEHLKCNATKAPDPKAVFQALRPVFNDYVSEIQRSIGFFSSVNRDAKIEKILAIGNGFKLAGLQKFLQQNLQYDVERVENFPGLVGDAVLSQPLFQENAMSFAVAYGLGLQMLGQTTIRTSLLPPEIRTARMIRRKKPWAVATAATLMAGLCLSTMGFAIAKSTVTVEKWKKAEDAVAAVQSNAASLKSEYDAAEGKNKTLREAGEFLVKPAEGRVRWLEVYKAINACLPAEGATVDEPHISKKSRIRIYSITCTENIDLKTWFDQVIAAAPHLKDYMAPEDVAKPPEGQGWIFTLRGLHFHEKKDQFMIDNFLKHLQQWQMKIDHPGGQFEIVPVRQMGISHVMSIHSLAKQREWYPNGPPVDGSGLAGGPGGPGGAVGAGIRPGGLGGLGARPPGGAGIRPPAGGGAARFGERVSKAGKNAPGVANPADPLSNHPVEMIWQTDFEIVFIWKETPENLRPEKPPEFVPAEGAAGAGAAPGAPGAPVPPPGATPGAPPPTAAPAGAAVPPGAPMPPAGVGAPPAAG